MAYKFEISLQALNLLGRGLYRNFATVVAEAISNSWDAEATKVDIEIDKSKERMIIKDNGKGMSDDDFQNKFLEIGYSRREDKTNKSSRIVLGRKGIGKLALLSIAKQVTINTKKLGCKEVGGIINNDDLDKAIKKGKRTEDYDLDDIKKNIFKEDEHGTHLTFEGIKESMNNPEIIKKYLAIIFNFTLSSPGETFEMSINGEPVDKNCLKSLYENTQYIWSIGKLEDEVPKYLLDTDFMERQGRGNDREIIKADREKKELERKTFEAYNKKKKITETHTIQGYIASVSIPSDLTIRGSGGEFRARLNLFVNGRLRHEDVLEDVPPDITSQLPTRYFYGEIHVNSFDKMQKNDDGDDDIFTSNRESVIKDDPRYKEFIKALAEISREVITFWNEWRRKKNKKNTTPKDLEGMRADKKKFFDRLERISPAEDTSVVLEIVGEEAKKIVPPKPDKRVLICHTFDDKDLADMVEKELIDRGILPEVILYSNSQNPISRIKTGVDIYEYIREFFIQDWFDPPIIIFVVSKEMEESWGASLEAGASWVISENKNNQFITVVHNHEPKNPLPINKLYLRFDELKEGFSDEIDTKRIFDEIVDKIIKRDGLQIFPTNEFLGVEMFAKLDDSNFASIKNDVHSFLASNNVNLDSGIAINFVENMDDDVHLALPFYSELGKDSVKSLYHDDISNIAGGEVGLSLSARLGLSAGDSVGAIAIAKSVLATYKK